MILRKNNNWSVCGQRAGAVYIMVALGLHVALALVFTVPLHSEEVSGDRAVAVLISACIYT